MAKCFIAANTGGFTTEDPFNYIDWRFNVIYAGADVTNGSQSDDIIVRVAITDTLAQMASKIITEAIHIALSRWYLTVARTDVVIPSYQWGT